MREAFVESLRCPHCKQTLVLEARRREAGTVLEGGLRCRCGRTFPVIAGVPRILPSDLAVSLPVLDPDFFRRNPDLVPSPMEARDVGTRHPKQRRASQRTQRLFGDEWQRFPRLLEVHERIFRWYFEGTEPVRWDGLRVLDAGCGMGRWLHFARQAGARVVGMDASPALDVAAAREGERADFVQADLRWPPFAPGSFDLVYSLGVVHHLEDPREGVRVLASLVRPGGELRLYVYRSLEEEGFAKRALLGGVTLLRRVTTRLPFGALHAIAWAVAAVATALFLVSRRVLRHSGIGERLTRRLPLVQYADVPFSMLVAEQFDRLGAPIEGRFRREEVEAWIRDVGFDSRAILPGLGWRVIARRPLVV